MKCIVVGKVGKSFALEGWVKVYSFTDPYDQLTAYSNWQFQDSKRNWRPAELEQFKWHGDNLIAKFAGYNSPEAAQALTNLLIGVDRTQFSPPAENEYYWVDLEGLNVVTTLGVKLGHITHLMNTGANDVMFVKGERERVLPYLPEQVVKKVDLAKGEMIVDWDPEF